MCVGQRDAEAELALDALENLDGAGVAVLLAIVEHRALSQNPKLNDLRGGVINTLFVVIPGQPRE